MGVDYYVVGVLESARVNALKIVYDQCQILGVTPPIECTRLFYDDDYSEVLGDDYVEGLGVTVDIESVEGSDAYRSWLLVSLANVPDGVKSLAFVASY